MSVSADALYKMSDVALLAAYVEARQQFVERKFARDTQRARLDWLRAKMFVGSPGGVTERNMAIDVSEEIARKGQELREMTRELDLLKVDVDVIGIVIRSRGTTAPVATQAEDGVHGDAERRPLRRLRHPLDVRALWPSHGSRYRVGYLRKRSG